jgi:hypothetical protein
VAVCANRQRIGGHRGKQLLRRRGELVERTFAHAYETGALRRLYVRGKQNVQKRLLLQAAACNLALLLRKMMGAGTPRALHDVVANYLFAPLHLISAINAIPVTSHSCRLACRAGYCIAVDVFDGKLHARNRRFRHGLLAGGIALELVRRVRRCPDL